MQTEMIISGTTPQAAAVHQYVGELGRESFFSKAQLESIESVKRNNNGDMQFELHLLIQPGYGQPGGPKSPPIAQDKDDKALSPKS